MPQAGSEKLSQAGREPSSLWIILPQSVGYLQGLPQSIGYLHGLPQSIRYLHRLPKSIGYLHGLSQSQAMKNICRRSSRSDVPQCLGLHSSD